MGSIGLRLPSPERLQRQGGVHHLEELASASSQSAAIPASTCTVRCVVINVDLSCVEEIQCIVCSPSTILLRTA